MKVILFGCGRKAIAVLDKLIELGENVVGVVYSDVDAHENVDSKIIQSLLQQRNVKAFYGNSGDVTGKLKEIDPDVIFVVGWRYKIPREQYLIPSKGTVVLHDSLLPKYRGFAPMNWAIINGETKTGATMFYIADEIDSGDIVGQAEIPITEYDDAKTVETKVTQAYLGLLTIYLPLIKLNKVQRTPQNRTQATYTCKRIPSDGLIDWSKMHWQVYNFIRGLADPYPGAFTYLRDNKTLRKLMVWKAILDIEGKNYVGCVPGRVVDIIKGVGVRVLTGYGTLIIEEVGFEDGKKVLADEVIRSIKTTLFAIDKY